MNVSSPPTRPLSEGVSSFRRDTEPLGNPNPLGNEQGAESPKITIPLSPLSKEKVAYVSPVDKDLAEKYSSWHIGAKNGYVQHQRREGDKKKYTYIHREIAQRILNRPLTKNDVVEHESGNKLDNRRENVKVISRSEYIRKKKQGNITRNRDVNEHRNKTGYKGVTYVKSRKKWQAQIEIHGKKKSLGRYDTPQEASKAYNEALIKYQEESTQIEKLSSEQTIINFKQEEEK